MSSHLTAILARARCDTDRHRTAVRWHTPCGTPHDLSYGSLVAWALAVGSVLHEEAALAPPPPPPPPPPHPPCPATHAVPRMRIVAVGSIEGRGEELGVAAWPVLWLAVLLADPLVLLPLDAGEQQPTPRLRRMLEPAAPAVVVVETAAQAARVRAAGAEGRVVLARDVLRRAAARMGAGAAAAEAAYAEEAVSHVFFTSGSTGAPKGCVCSRRALRSYCAGKAAAHGVDAASVVLVASSHAFDPSLGDFVSAWAAGACAALFAPDAVAAGLGACLRAAAATHCLAAPSLAAPLLQREGPLTAAAYPALRVVALGGETLPGFVAAAFAAPECAARLANTYGVTECVGYQTLGFVGGGEASDVGTPLAADTSVVVVHDAAASKAARGGGGGRGAVFAGEVWVTGAQVGLGYIVSPTQVLRPAERYVEHPVWGRCFKTGDIVELVGWAGAAPASAPAPLETGRVHAASSCTEGWEAVPGRAEGGEQGGCAVRLLGRRDGMVKLRGRRIEVAEVESCLRAGAAALLSDVCVCLYEDKPRRSPPTLAAFCVVAGGWGGGTGAGEEAGALRAVLRALCVAALPAYMVPGVFVLFVGGDVGGGGGGEGALLPRTASGKVDRRLLVGSAAVRSCVACRSVHNGVFAAEGEGSFKERYLDGREGLCAGACYSADEIDDGEGGGGGGAREPTPWERAVAGVWSEVLQLGWGADASSVSRRRLQRADFGELGGDSLQAVRVCKAVAAMVASRGGCTTPAVPAPSVPSAGGGGVSGGVYGELLAEPLLPKELMRRPRLREYAQHLQEHYSDCCGDGDGSSGEEDGKKKSAAEEHEERSDDDDADDGDDDVPWTASAARAGNLSFLNYLCDAPLHTLLLPADAARVWGRSPAAGAAGATAAVLRTNAFCVACLAHQEAAARALKARFDAASSSASASAAGGGSGGCVASPDGATLHELLCRVVRRGDAPLSLVRLLLAACASPPRHPARAVVLRRDAREGQTPLHHCARGGGAAKVLDALLEPLRAGGSGGASSSAAAAAGRRGGGIGAEFLDSYGRTPLHWCVINAHAALVGLLVAADADGGAWPAGAMLAARDAQGETAVEMAERRAVCAAAGMRPDGVAVSVFGSIAKVLGGSGGTKNLKKTGKM